MPGTAGLGLFLVPREVEGRPNGFRLRRLKDKLGTRSMVTAEIDFDGAYAEALGPMEDGFRNTMELIVDTSRLYNAFACAGRPRAFLGTEATPSTPRFGASNPPVPRSGDPA